jgi:hypothetical protein
LESSAPQAGKDADMDSTANEMAQRDVPDCLATMAAHIQRPVDWIVSLRSLEVATRVYGPLHGATVSLRIIDQDLSKMLWMPESLKRVRTCIDSSQLAKFRNAISIPVDRHVDTMTRAESFSCVAMFESGHFNIDPDKLSEVIALCSEDSIFVSEILLSSPDIDASQLGLRHMVGNIGHAGMVLMVSPLEPRIRQVQHDAALVDHLPYDHKSTDSFVGTSLHLSFTKWKMPLDWTNTGEIDQEIFLLESVVSVQDNGTWVADIDVLGREKHSPDVLSFSCECPADGDAGERDMVSLDSWEELLDQPPCTGIMRARSNWVARLAATSILIQQGRAHTAVIVGDGRICLMCLKEFYSDPEPHVPEVVIY